MRGGRRKRLQVHESARFESSAVARTWALRLVLDMGGWRKVDDLNMIECLLGDVAETIEEYWGEEEPTDARACRQILQSLRPEPALWADEQGVLKENLAALASCIGLNPVEERLLAFATLVTVDRALQMAAALRDDLSLEQVYWLLGDLLDIGQPELRQSLSNAGLLHRAGLLRVDRSGPCELATKLMLMDGLAENLLVTHCDVYELMEAYVCRATPGSLQLSDFDHVRDDFVLFHSYLGVCLDNELEGVNLLLHGPPGTGKTEMAKLLAARTGADLFTVSLETDEGDAINGGRRFRAYQLGQHFLAGHKRALILFDEIEDVFSTEESFGPAQRYNMGKGWVNRLLEENAVPAIWITNNVGQIDPAYLRRFDAVFNLDTPPHSARLRMLQQGLHPLPVSDGWINHAAENTHLAPALIARAAKVVRTAENDAAAEEDLARLLNGTLKSMQRDMAPIALRPPPDLAYRLAYVNADQDLDEIVGALGESQMGARFCLYGYPGTGKTGFARYLARRLEKPLIVQRASDLLDMWVGATEQNLARMFERATRERSVLLLDEADSFLQDRRSAQQSWEVSQVNELLTQMESFDGIFICSTNLLTALDQASLRRFDFKIQFDYLASAQVLAMFEAALGKVDWEDPALQSVRQSLLRQDRLTPGDFATVLRRLRLLARELTPASLLAGLIEEAGFKEDDGKRRVGFLT